MDLLFSMIPSIMLVAAPIIIGALAGIFSERCGIINIALEGIMMVGAFVASTVCVILETNATFAPYAGWLGIVAGLIVGGVYSLLLGLSTISFKADHTIAGTALNLLAGGLTIFLCQLIFGMQRSEAFSKGISKIKEVPILSKIPFIGDKIFVNIYPTIFVAIVLVIISYIVLYKTKFGLRLRSCGENPQASASMGINVYKFRYIGVIISGCLAGLAGGCLVLTETTQYTITSIHGIGFISLAAVIFGRWNPFGVLGAGIFFGFSSAIAVYASNIPIIRVIPTEFYAVIPYVFTIFALIIFSNKSVGPKAAGEIYDKGKR